MSDIEPIVINGISYNVSTEARLVTLAQILLKELHGEIQDLERQLEAARSLTLSLEAEAHACPNHGHHRGWWADHTEDL